MGMYIPEGVNMDDVDKEFDAPRIWLPKVRNPLDETSPSTATQAVERLCAHMYEAQGDPNTRRLQWHAANVSIYPWNIEYDNFCKIIEQEMAADFPVFDNESEMEAFFWTVENALTKVEDH